MTRILIVEDSATQAQELAFLLEEKGFEIEIARDGETGLERLAKATYDVVLSDVVMPGIDGYELCRRAKLDPQTRNVPVVLLTSLSEPMDVIRGLECGADNFITKPFDSEYLVGRVQALLENRGLRNSRKLDVGVELMLMGKRFTINSQKEQMVDLLISTFEEVLRSRQREFEAKAAQETHRQSHMLLQSALDALSGQIVIVDISGSIVAVNAAWRRMGDIAGWTWPGAGVGQDYRSVFETAYGASPERVRLALTGLERIRKGQEHFFYLEYPGKLREQARWFALSATRFEGDGLVLLAIENQDVTDRKQATENVARSEQALRQQTQILNSILNSMSEAVVVADRDGGLILANPRAEELLGMRSDGENTHDLPRLFAAYLPDGKTPLPPEEHPMRRAIAGNETRDLDIYCRSSDKTTGTRLAVTAAPLRDDAGVFAGGIVVARDVTQQRKLEQQFQESQKMEAIGQLAGGVAHDFNNLLSVIMSYAQLLQREFADKPGPLEDLSQLLGAATRAATLTRQLLAFSRRQMVSPCVLELNTLVSNLEKMLRRIIGEDIDFATQLDPELSRVCADSGQVEQVLMNLCVNARDAMPNGGKLTIGTANAVLDDSFARSHAGTAAGRYVMLAVSDTGSGMDAQTQAHIFEPFFTTKEVGKGTGLGLSTVYGIVHQSGGHIWVYSEVGKGTSFKIYFPMVDEPMNLKPILRPSAPPVKATGMVLLVEDDDPVRFVASRILRQSGYEVLEASGPEQARLLFGKHKHSIDLLLTDVIMPNTSGPELAAQLVCERPELRVLFMSGYSGTAVFRHGEVESGKAFLEKPFTPELLNQRVREALDAAVEPSCGVLEPHALGLGHRV